MTSRTVCIGSFCVTFPRREGMARETVRDLLINLGVLVLAGFAAVGLFLLGYHYGPPYPEAWESPLTQFAWFLSQ